MGVERIFSSGEGSKNRFLQEVAKRNFSGVANSGEISLYQLKTNIFVLKS